MLSLWLFPLHLHLNRIDLVHDLHPTTAGLLPNLSLIDLQSWVAERSSMAIDACCRPLHVARVDSDICDTITMIFVFRFFNELAGPDIVDIS